MLHVNAYRSYTNCILLRITIRTSDNELHHQGICRTYAYFIQFNNISACLQLTSVFLYFFTGNCRNHIRCSGKVLSPLYHIKNNNPRYISAPATFPFAGILVGAMTRVMIAVLNIHPHTGSPVLPLATIMNSVIRKASHPA